MIDVVWCEGMKGFWDHGIFLLTFEKYPDLFIQHEEKLSRSFERAIIVVAGKPKVSKLKGYLKTIQSGVVIFASEEDAFFPWKEVMHDGLVPWTQYYHPSTKSEIKERILLGAPYRIKDFKINKHLPKKYLWSFVGQVQNPSRQQCVEVLRTLPDGYLKEISGFGGYTDDGMEYQEYLDIMCQSKFVICPSGSMSVDSFRLYEAMECGAIPITDKRSPRDAKDFNYWDELYPENTLVQVEEWTGGAIRQILLFNDPEILTSNDWWETYKQQLEQKLLNLAQ